APRPATARLRLVKKAPGERDNQEEPADRGYRLEMLLRETERLVSEVEPPALELLPPREKRVIELELGDRARRGSFPRQNQVGDRAANHDERTRQRREHEHGERDARASLPYRP